MGEGRERRTLHCTMASLKAFIVEDSMDIDFDSIPVVEDLLENVCFAGDSEEVYHIRQEKTKHDDSKKPKKLINLNQLAKEALAIEMDHEYSEHVKTQKVAEDMNLVIEDSLENDRLWDDDGQETIYRGKSRTALQVVEVSESLPLASTSNNEKKLFDLNKYQEEGHDFGLESEALNMEFLTLLKIYLPKLF